MANFVPGALASADLNAALECYQPLNPQTGTTYTFALTDSGGLVTASNASAQTYTVPLNATVAFATGVRIDVLNIGAGGVTLAATGGVTLNGCKVVPPNARVRLIKQATDTWYAQVTTAGGGVVATGSAAPAAAASFSIDGCFSSAFDCYRIVWSIASTAGTVNLLVRMRVAGVDNSAASYYDSAGSSGGTSFILGSVTASGGWGTGQLWFPASAVATYGQSVASASVAAPSVANVAQSHNVATAYDGLTVTASSSTLTGWLRVYPVPNA